jgi:hypothetical protein
MYGWIIKRDVLFETGDHIEGETDATGTMGGHDTTFSKEEILKGVSFQMFDDDMNLYYEGKIIGDYDGFEPLDDFGMPNAGCISIWYDGKRL